VRAVGFTEQPRLTLQRAEERRQIAIDERAHDLFHDKRVPQSGPCGVREVERSLFNQVHQAARWETPNGRDCPRAV